MTVTDADRERFARIRRDAAEGAGASVEDTAWLCTHVVELLGEICELKFQLDPFNFEQVAHYQLDREQWQALVALIEDDSPPPQALVDLMRGKP